MPFKKTGKDEYTSPSGKKFKGSQVKAYYAKTTKKEARPKAKKNVRIKY